MNISTGLIYTTEHTDNPAIPDYFTALYFGLTTLTTVGFGDIAPVTTEGKLIVSGDLLAGVITFSLSIACPRIQWYWCRSRLFTLLYKHYKYY